MRARNVILVAVVVMLAFLIKTHVLSRPSEAGVQAPTAANPVAAAKPDLPIQKMHDMSVVFPHED